MFVLLQTGYEKIQASLVMHIRVRHYRCQTWIIGFKTFSFTCVVMYFKPLIINQVTELTWLCYDLCLFVTDRLQKKKASLLMHIKARHCIGVKP